MADWNSLTTSPERNGDFMSLFTTKTSSPLYRMNGHLSELQFSPSPHRNTGQNGSEPFCSKDNMDHCVSLINQEVTTLGMDCLYEKNSEVFDSVRLINCTHELLQRHQRSSRIREELENRKHRTEVDIQNLQLAHTKLKATLEQNDRILRQQQEKERQLVNKNKLLVSRLKMEKEEVKKLQSVIQHRDAQFKHEIKKKERELMKLKDRIHLLLTDKTEKRIGLEIANPLPRSDGKRGTWKTGNKQEEEMYRSVISNYEEKQKELMVENTELRQCLRDMQKELVGLLNTPDSSIGVSTSNSPFPEMRDLSDMTEEEDISEADGLSEAHFEMPYEFIRGDIEKSLKDKYKLLKDYIRKVETNKGVLTSAESISQPIEEQMPKAPSTPAAVREDKYKREVEKLNKQIGRYRDIIEQQEKLLQNQLDVAQQDDPVDLSILQTSELYEEKERLETERKFFKEQKTNFEEERKKFTEAAITLAQQRKEFEEERTTFLQNQFLQITPFREANNKTAEITKTAPTEDPIPFSLADKKKSSSENLYSNGVTEKEKVDSQVENVAKDAVTMETVAKDTQTGGSLSPSPNDSSDAGQSPVLGGFSKGTSLEDIGEVPNQSFSRKPRSKRLLPATPSSTPAPATNSSTPSGKNAHHSSAHHPPVVTVPRVMARPHSSIAIADGQNSDSSSSLPTHQHAPSSSSFAPKALRPRSSAPSTAELYKKLGLEPPKDRSNRERSKPSRHHPEGVYHSQSRDSKASSHHDNEYHDNPHTERSSYRERSYTDHSVSSGGSRDRSELTSSSQEYGDKENHHQSGRERSRDSGIGVRVSSRERFDRDRYYEVHTDRSAAEGSHGGGESGGREYRASSGQSREKSRDRGGGAGERERSWERKRDRGSHQSGGDEDWQQHQQVPSLSATGTSSSSSTRPRTARERSKPSSPSLERSRSLREPRPKSSATKEDTSNYVDSGSRRKSMSSKDLDRHERSNPARYSLGGREASFDYSTYSRENTRYSREDREHSRERRESPSREVKRSHSSAGYPWRRSSGSYVASPLVLRNPEQTHSRSASRK